MELRKKGNILRIIKGIIIAILFVALILNVYVILQAKIKPNSVPSVLGYKPFVVLSGSMETEIYVGDLVIIKEVDTSTLQVNDIIAFRDSDNLVTTHRIVNTVNTDKGLCFETKGDKNNTNDDELVCSDNIEGKYHSRISKIGNAILFIQEPLGFIIMMMSLFIICIFIYLFENRKINKNIVITNDEEMKEFEEFKRAKEMAKQKQQEKGKK